MNGDFIHQEGDGNVEKAVHSGSGDIVTGGKTGTRSEEISTLIEEIQALRQHLDSGDREAIDASAEELTSNPSSGRLRNLLQQIAGIATVAGEMGAPVISAVRAVAGAL